MSQKNRISISNEQRLMLLRELVSIRRSLSEELALSGISQAAIEAAAHELGQVKDLIRKLERHSPYQEGVNY